MQRPINETFISDKLEITVNIWVKQIYIATNLDKMNKKTVKLNQLFPDGIKDRDVTKYFPGMEPISYQSMIYYAETDEKFEDSAYKDFL